MSIATAEKKYALHPAFYLIAALLLGLLVATFSLRFSPILALVAAVGLGVALIFLRYPEYALLLTVALIPIERFGRFTDDNTHFTISLMRIMGVLVLGILIVHKLVKNESFSFGKPFFLYAGYAGLALLSIVYTTDFLGSVRAASTIVGNLLFYFVVINMVTNRKRVWKSVV